MNKFKKYVKKRTSRRIEPIDPSRIYVNDMRVVMFDGRDHSESETAFQTVIIPNNVNTQKRICQICRDPESIPVKVRKFDYKKLPTEYFHPPSNSVRLVAEEKDMFPNLWVHLPQDKFLTKYDTLCCVNCYQNIQVDGIDPWNYWEDL